MLAIGASADSAIGFADGGLLSGLGTDIGKKVSSDFSNRIISDTNTSPDRIRYFGDPVSMFGYNSTVAVRQLCFQWVSGGKISAHSYKGLQIADKVTLHDTKKNPLTPSPGDSLAEVITE